MRKGIKGMAALLCACMMLEMACGSVFAKQTEGDKAASTLEEAATEVTAESDASTDEAETEAVEEQEAPAEEAEDGEEPEDASKSEENSESDDVPEIDGDDILGTEAAEETDGDSETPAPELDDAPDAEDSSMQEGVPEEETLETESAQTAGEQAGLAVIADKPDYYIAVGVGTKSLTIIEDIAGMQGDFIKVNDHTLPASQSWRLDKRVDDITKVEKVEFRGSITLNGEHFLSGFTNLETVDISKGKVTIMKSANGMFSDCKKLAQIKGLENLHANTGVFSSQYMFKDCEKLETLEVPNLFDSAASLSQINHTFEGCSALISLDLSNWKTTKVYAGNGNDIFKDCYNLRELKVGENFKLPVSSNTYNIHNDTTGRWIEKKSPDVPLNDQELITHFESDQNAGGTYYWAHQLIYDSNGGVGREVTDDEWYPYDEEPVLKEKGDLSKDGAVFVGWSEKCKSELVSSKDDAADVLKPGNNGPKFKDENITLYAVWAEDKNGNEIADYEEDKVTVTFDINDGDGSKDKNHTDTYSLTDQLPGMPLRMYVHAMLKWEKNWQKDGVAAEHPAILAGWTTDKNLASKIILEDDKDKGDAALSDKLVNRTNAKVPGENTTYYAVYAADENDDQIVDYLENSVHVEYYANGGQRVDGLDWMEGNDGLFYRCSHHHVPFEDGVVLLDLEHGKAYVEREGAVLLGWSEEAVKDLVTSTEAQGAANIVTEITMPLAGNKKVYAVWAEDRNKNGKADYTEKQVKLTFDIGGGDGSEDPTYKTTFTVEALPGIDFDVPHYSEIHWIKKWEKDGQPAEYPAVLAGWADHPVSSDIILEDDINDKAETHAHLSDQMIKAPKITVPTTDATYYAMYAADENHDDEPDYLEFAEQVEYYANGGKMVSGSWLDGIEGLFYRCGHHHVAGEEVTLLRLERGKEMITRDGAVLLGWSAKQVPLVTTEDDENGASIASTFRMPGGGNGRVYAVWAEDVNGNEIPDYKDGSAQKPPEPELPDDEPPVEKPDHPYWNFYTGIYGAGSVQNASAGWVQDANGWKYYYANGTYAASKWELIKDKWYYFKANGYMLTGWQLIGGVWYHLDDSDGDMDTGWYFDQSDGYWYYLDASGAMLTGWQTISGKSYYLHEGTMAETGRPFGSMYANETTPDGYTVDASGAWVQ